MEGRKGHQGSKEVKQQTKKRAKKCIKVLGKKQKDIVVWYGLTNQASKHIKTTNKNKR